MSITRNTVKNSCCKAKFVIAERINRGVHDLGDSGYEDINLACGILGENDALFMQLLCALCDVERMVGDTLEVVYRVQIFAYGLVLLGV